MCKQLRFSIRKINEDEIEIRNSFFDGYTRGFIRLLFIGIFCMSWYQNAKYKQPPFSYEIAAIKEDFVWTFNKKSIIKPLYEDHVKDHNDPEFIKMFPNNKLLSYEEYEKLYTDNVWGIPIFLAIMAFIFFLTFTIGDIFKNYLVEGIDIVSNDLMAILNSIDVSPIISSLLIDGAIAGIGGILAFLPNIFILFLALAVLEDSGYMSRVAYVMDSVMGKIGLSGRAFIPLLLGFGCSVPAIMASRALEDPKDRLRTILVTPFMSCSARLPIYILFSGMFFPEYAMFVAFSMYVIGIVMAIIIAKIFYKVSDKSDKKVLLIELPEYKSPNVMSIFLYAWEKVKSYLAKAGTTIFVASIIIWFILNFNFSGMVDIGDSFGAQIGRLIAPILVPAGLGLWQIAVALISGIAAKEVVVASLSVLYGILNINSAEGMNTLVGQLAQVGFHELNAYVLMVFCLLYTPCIASIVTIKKETNSKKWTCFAIFFQLLIAYLVAVIIYQVGSNILY